MLLRAAHGRCHHLRSGAHPLVFGADLPGEAQQARAGVPAAQAGDGHRAVAAGNYCDQSIHGNRGAGDLSYDHGPVLYKQVRLTKDGRLFEILKLRSMIVDAEKGGARLAGAHDDRITPIGRIIRAIRFDELPQLFNILKGDMSIVGPRPERPEIAEQYRQELPAFDLRLQVKAGLTGYAQIYGRYNTEPQDKLKMDLMYINHASLAEDIKLIFATVRVLFLRDSTSGVAEGQTTASAVEKEKSA